MRLIKKNIDIDLPIFATEAYLQSKSDNYGWFIDNDFIIPFTIEKKLIFKRLIFSNATIYLNKNLNSEDEKNFLNEVVVYCKKHKICDFIYKAQANAIFNTYPEGSEQIEWGTYELSLKPSMEELLSKFYARDRTKVRKAIKLGVTVRTTDDTEEIYKNIKDTFQRQKSLFFPSLEYLKKLQKNLRGHIKFFIVEHENITQGSAIIIYDKHRAYYLYGGSISKPTNGSINLMHYKMMQFFKEEDIPIYDFVGARFCLEKASKFEALQKFKSRFGTTLKKGYAFRVVINPIKFKLFTLLVESYFRVKKSQYLDPIDSIRRCSEQRTSNF
jgi:lipid II:glycine glycyltransferase (peptidoglycan interpeptide bridge formation enzyme)